MARPPGWLFQRRRDLPASRDWLTPAEVELFAGVQNEVRRRDWLLGRWTAKRALALASGLSESSLAELEIRPADTGAPRAFWQNRQLGIAFSLSHRQGAALCAVAREGVVGCDLEWIEPRSQAFVDDYFTAREAAAVNGVEEGLTLLANGIWSAKESVLKLRESGLRTATKSLTVDSSAGVILPEWHGFTVHIDGEEAVYKGWWRRLDDWVLTVVSDPPARRPERLG